MPGSRLLNFVKKVLRIYYYSLKAVLLENNISMKKFLLFSALISVLLLLQQCKKDVVTATTFSNKTLFAAINDTVWTANTVNASITYNSASKTKVFSCNGAGTDRQINLLITQNKAANTAGFPIGTFNVDSTSNVVLSYYTLQRNNSGVIGLAPQGTVHPGSGTIIISGIDSVKRQITGTFSFVSYKNFYDSQGNITAVNTAVITAGAFNNLPYTFASN